jgi:hypothetical protein
MVAPKREFQAQPMAKQFHGFSLGASRVLSLGFAANGIETLPAKVAKVPAPHRFSMVGATESEPVTPPV